MELTFLMKTGGHYYWRLTKTDRYKGMFFMLLLNDSALNCPQISQKSKWD